jgi:hypothetical protein
MEQSHYSEKGQKQRFISIFILKNTLFLFKQQSEEADLIDLSTEFVVEEELPAVDWGDFQSANNTQSKFTGQQTANQISPSGGGGKAISGNQLPLDERVRMVLEALRNLLMMNPG